MTKVSKIPTAAPMNHEEKILALLAGIQSDVTGLKTDASELKTDVTELKADVAGLKTDVTELKADVVALKTDVVLLKEGQSRLEKRQDTLEQHMIHLENELIPKVSVLFDTFELRGDQITKLQSEFNEHFDDVQNDMNFLFVKTIKHKKQLSPYLSKYENWQKLLLRM